MVQDELLQLSDTDTKSSNAFRSDLYDENVLTLMKQIRNDRFVILMCLKNATKYKWWTKTLNVLSLACT